MRLLAYFPICLLATACQKPVSEPAPVTGSSYYYPPQTGDAWETVSPAQLNWNTAKLNDAIAYAQQRNTYGLIILHKGRIVIENYWNNWTATTRYPIASAGKSVAATLVGIAQTEKKLSINDRTSTHLGVGWTSAPLAKENLITIRHQITMTTGLDELGGPENCTRPECLTYKADAGTRWYYYNSPYRLVLDVLESATKQSIHEYTKSRLADRIGMKNFTWVNYILWLNTRDMARFGLLTLSKGQWNNQPILTDDAYFKAMTTPSNPFNKSYGYLWWLNGQDSFMVPTLTRVIPGALAPSAPPDMISALGAGDKKIYVVPSLDLVVVRHGDDTGAALLGPSSFDEGFWALLKQAMP
ncbi:MAG: class C beta-lactamase-related serine hydrolase [Cytophagales bacterium]|nr:MAG: class C beta-lactamase-related serine hydrolase [Cytophagales bacterium]